jgi:PAS domain S-box-containing protein
MRTLVLRNKFLIVTMGLVAALGLSVIVFVESTLTHKLLLQLRQKGIFIARHLADSSVNNVLTEKTVLLQLAVNDHLQNDEDISYIFIQNARGEALAHTFSGGFPRELRGAHQPGDGRTYSVQPLHIDGGNILDIAAPMLAGGAGWVHVGITEENIRKSVAAIVTTLIQIIGVVLIAGGVLAAVFAVRITRPLAELVEATRAIGAGNLGRRARISTKDEIGQLGSAFNAMIESLERTTVSKDYVDNVIGSMMDALIVAAEDGTIVQVNAAGCRLLECAEAELVGHPLDAVIEAGPHEGLSIVGEALSRGGIENSERLCLTGRGRLAPVLLSASVMQDVHSGAKRVVCVVRDITDRKRAEEKLRNYSEDLREINEELKNFAYIVSHDLRAPLVNIKGFSEELIIGIRELGPLLEKYLEGFPDEEQRKFSEVLKKDIPEALRFIGSSVNRMDHLINAILKLSRAGRRKLNPERINVAELIRTVLDSLAHQLESRCAQVSAAELPGIIADRTALEQIFGNLLDNAVKYLDPARNGEIHIFSEQGGEDVVFHVRDNGRGMAKEDIPRAFEIFRRVGPQDAPGEGMGLAYVKALVRLHGGRIWCESEPGVGTTFSFSIPRREEESDGGNEG